MEVMYAVLLGTFVVACAAYIRWRGLRDILLPSSYYTLLMMVVTGTDAISLGSDHPNYWPASFAVDPIDLRLKPLLIVMLSMASFWVGSAVVRVARARRIVGIATGERPSVAEFGGGTHLRLQGLGIAFIGVVSVLVTASALGIGSLGQFLDNMSAYGWRMGSEGLYIYLIGYSLFPVGVALLVPEHWLVGRRVLIALALLAVVGFFFNASKAGPLLAALHFVVGCYWRLGRLPDFVRRPLRAGSIALALAVLLAVKTQLKYGGSVSALSSQGLVESLEVGGGRFVGQTFQTFCVISRAFENQSFRDGTFVIGGLSNLVPRVMWPDKPMTPVQGLFQYLLDGPNEDLSGAALMAQGVFYVDWGIPGVAIGFLVVGLLLGTLEERAMARGPFGRWASLQCAAVLSMPSFLEGGTVSALPTFAGYVVLLYLARGFALLVGGERVGFRTARREAAALAGSEAAQANRSPL